MSNSTYIKRLVEPSETNPFINELSRSIVSGKKFNSVSTSMQQVVDTSTGEITAQEVRLSTAKPVERKDFLKLFSAGISAMFDLPKGPQDMFKAILQIYVAQKFTPETIYLNPDSLLEAGYDRQKATRIKSMNILINKGFLAEVKNRPHQFWINPNMFFKGDRMTLVQSYAIKGTPSGDQMAEKIEEEKANQNQGKLL